MGNSDGRRGCSFEGESKEIQREPVQIFVWSVERVVGRSGFTFGMRSDGDWVLGCSSKWKCFQCF